MAIYLQYDGMEGDAKESSHENWIQCKSMSFSANREATSKLGQGGGRQGSSVEIGDITLTLPMGPASPHLYMASLVGGGKKAKIHITRTGEGAQTNYLEAALDHACVSYYAMNSNGAAHLETITLNSLKVELKYIPINSDASPGDPIPVSINLATGKTGS